MSVFAYRGRRAGEPVEGRLEAVSSEAVARELSGLGITPIAIDRVAEAKSDDVRDLLAGLRRRRVKIEDLVSFSRQMHSLHRAGLPLLRGLRSIIETTRNPTLASALRDVFESLEAGHGLATGLQRHAEIFSPLYVNTVAMGEQMGRLDEAFTQLARHLETERDTRKRIWAATRYPLVVVVGVVIAVAILNLFVLPVFADVFREFGAELPLPTRLLIASSTFTQAYWPHLLVTTALAVLAIRQYLNSPSGRLRWDRAKLRIPVVGSILERATLARFARSISLALASGVPLLEGLRVTARVVDNEWMATRLEEVGERIERGETLTRAAVASELFTPLVLQMLAVGEETGALEELLGEVAVFYESEVDYDLRRLSESIEPALIVALGALVLVLALGVYLPMWNLAGAARGA